MKRPSRNKLLVGTALPILLAFGLYACNDTLTKAAEPQGTLDPSTITTPAGVEASLIATYRALDWFDDAGFDSWGWAASNWVWASVTSDDAYKGSEASDQPGVTDIELFNWTTNGTDLYLNDAWKGAYEGINRANTTLNLLKAVQEKSPGLIAEADAASITGEAIFLRAHYHFKAWRMWGNIPYFRGTDTDFRKPNEDSATVVNELLTDLDSAIALLPE